MTCRVCFVNFVNVVILVSAPSAVSGERLSAAQAADTLW
jgi:hypothetical protein